jgi:hypothetical protein
MTNGNIELTPSLKIDQKKKIKRKRLGWLGNLVRMEDRSTVKMLFMGNPGGKRRDGRHRITQHDNVQVDLTYVGVRRASKREKKAAERTRSSTGLETTDE